MPEKNDPKLVRLVQHAFSACREVGVLLVAFGPLEAALKATAGSEAGNSPAGLVFFAIGISVFVTALFLEWRLLDVR